jgi:hypothetical protein
MEIEDRPRLRRQTQRDLRALRLPLQLAARAAASTPCSACQIAGFLRFGLQRRAQGISSAPADIASFSPRMRPTWNRTSAWPGDGLENPFR